MERLASDYAASAGFALDEMAGFSRIQSDLTIEDEIVEDAKSVTVIERVIYTKKGTDLVSLGCFHCYADKQTGSLVCVPITCPPAKLKRALT